MTGSRKPRRRTFAEILAEKEAKAPRRPAPTTLQDLTLRRVFPPPE